MRIDRLYSVFPDRNAVAMVLGTGPSMRCFPVEALRGAYLLGLNQAWKYVTPNLMLTVHPELYLEYRDHPDAAKIKVPWVIKKKPPMADLELDDPIHYVFHTSTDLKTAVEQPADTLYLGEGIQCTAIDLLARMGARTIILVGCDMCSLEGQFHGHDQHVRWLGQKPDTQYALYRKKTAQVRSAVRDAHKVNVLTLSPFIGLSGAEEDYGRLKKELNLKPLPKPKDISPYTRTTNG
jgi:hypothetical protein